MYAMMLQNIKKWCVDDVQKTHSVQDYTSMLLIMIMMRLISVIKKDMYVGVLVGVYLCRCVYMYVSVYVVRCVCK